MKYNDLHREYTLMPGDIIYLKSKKKKASKPHTVYIVKDGDDLWSLAKKYSTTEESILLNNELLSKELKTGDKILIFRESLSIL